MWFKVVAWQDHHCALIESFQNYADVVEWDSLHFVSVNWVVLLSIISIVKWMQETKGVLRPQPLPT